jgi:hypothetical protein
MTMRFGSMMSMGAALTIVLGCYTVSLKVSGERKAVDDLRNQIASDQRGIRTLQAELRTRSRLPELQRWNDEVLALAAPAAGQFVRDPVQLASYGVTAKPEPQAAPEVRYAVADAPAPAAAPVQTVAYHAPLQQAPQPSLRSVSLRPAQASLRKVSLSVVTSGLGLDDVVATSDRIRLR